MKFILMMNAPKKGWESLSGWPKGAFAAHCDFMKTFTQELGASGELVAAEGLDVPANAKIVRASNEGTPVIDGVFAETKEFLAGYWIVDVKSAERAYEIAAKASTAPGPTGAPLNMPLEVRQVMAGPPEDLL